MQRGGAQTTWRMNLANKSAFGVRGVRLNPWTLCTKWLVNTFWTNLIINQIKYDWKLYKANYLTWEVHSFRVSKLWPSWQKKIEKSLKFCEFLKFDFRFVFSTQNYMLGGVFKFWAFSFKILKKSANLAKSGWQWLAN